MSELPSEYSKLNALRWLTGYSRIGSIRHVAVKEARVSDVGHNIQQILYLRSHREASCWSLLYWSFGRCWDGHPYLIRMEAILDASSELTRESSCKAWIEEARIRYDYRTIPLVENLVLRDWISHTWVWSVRSWLSIVRAHRWNRILTFHAKKATMTKVATVVVAKPVWMVTAPDYINKIDVAKLIMKN